MQIGKILYPITTLGPGKRLGIWTTGCNRFCEGCSNPELQTFDKSKEISIDKIYEIIKDYEYTGITITGGEPFLQGKELKNLVKFFNELGYDDILIYSGFLKEELIQKNDKDINYILSNIAVLIDGPFIEQLVDEKPLRGSSNQNVWIFKDKYKDKYNEFLNEEKKIDIFHIGNEVHFIGIPFKNYKELYKKIKDQ